MLDVSDHVRAGRHQGTTVVNDPDSDRMRRAIAEQPEVIGEATLNLSISAGVASTEVFPAATAEELISRADVALYAVARRRFAGSGRRLTRWFRARRRRTGNEAGAEER